MKNYLLAPLRIIYKLQAIPETISCVKTMVKPKWKDTKLSMCANTLINLLVLFLLPCGAQPSV